MSNFLEQLVNDKTANDTQWREQMQAERDNTSAMQTAGINEITSNPEAYGLYLDLQGNNPTYSAGNLALVMLLKPEATVIGTRERWKLAGRSILDSEVKNSVKIFARSPTGKGYILADAYDVTQTAGRPIKQVALEDSSKAMEEATKRLLNFSAAPLAINKEMEMHCAPVHTTSHWAAPSSKIRDSPYHALKQHPAASLCRTQNPVDSA